MPEFGCAFESTISYLLLGQRKAKKSKGGIGKISEAKTPFILSRNARSGRIFIDACKNLSDTCMFLVIIGILGWVEFGAVE